MIVFDASTLVGAALKVDSIPERALLIALEADRIALSAVTFAEIEQVLNRPKFGRLLSAARRQAVLDLLRTSAAWFEPDIRVTDCRDDGDNKYLELAIKASAQIIVSSDQDLLALHPWRGVQILRPSDYLDRLGGRSTPFGAETDLARRTGSPAR